MENFIFGVIFGAITMLYRGWVATVLWRWFVVPLGLPTISLGHALGLALIVGWWAMEERKPDEDKTDVFELFGYQIVIITIMLIFGFLYHSFM